MRRHVLLCALLPLIVLGCPSETPAVCDNGACDQPDGSTPDSSPTGDGASPDGVAPPDGCDPNADPKDAPKCVVSEFGIFVDATTGNDGNSGTKDLPVRTFAAALTKLNGRPRIYVCEGTYPESVKLTSPISIYGGFACGSWTYTGVQSKVAPGIAGAEALVIENVKSRIVVSDIHAEAAPGDATKKNSIAVRVASSSEVVLFRSKLVSGAGLPATDEVAASTNLFSATVADLKGVDSTTTTGAAEKICACKSYGSSKGGRGGDGGDPAQNGSAGGSTPIAAANGARNSAGGNGYPNGVSLACEGGKPGPDGIARLAGVGADTHGTLSATGWSPAVGTNGEAGNPGSGGGGGGGADVNGSGSGGCGGCGGAGGVGAAGGGASIGIAAFMSSVTLRESFIATGSGGKGGAGGPAEGGGPGGAGGGGVGCPGGRGGNGAGGSGGGGGAGGISVAILRVGGALVRDAATSMALGAAGAGGAGGAAGAGGTNPLGTAPMGNGGSGGKDGIAQEVLEL